MTMNGYFTAYRRLAAEDLDLVVHLGDYIYEAGTLGPERAVRMRTTEITEHTEKNPISVSSVFPVVYVPAL